MKAWIETISNEEYHKKEGLSASGIKLLLECPRKYWWKYVMKKDTESSPALLEGTEFHTFILERLEFDQRYYTIPAGLNIKRNSNEGKANYEAQVKAANGRLLIDAERLEILTDMRASLYSIPRVAAILAKGIAEQCVFWQDLETGIVLKTKPDYTNHQVKILPDLKTTTDASYSAFSLAIYKYGYHIQAAMQQDGLKALTGYDYKPLYLPVEKSAPYCAAAYELNEADIDHGRSDYRKAIEIYKKCVKEAYWPSYSEFEEEGESKSIQTISIPYWAQQQYLMEAA